MPVVVDASVAVKWVLNEVGSAQANAIREEEGLIAPSLIAVEIGSALWKAVRRGHVSRLNALAALQASLMPFSELAPNETLHEQALSLALDVSHPVHDCFYLALAQRDDSPIITADEGMIVAARKANIKVRRI
jgi:predicted nucleic acid-binding protein